jgi:hypothetical protein
MDNFKSLTGEDMSLYAAQMEQVKARIDAASHFLQQPKTYPSVEAGLLQLRMALETIALSSLITNRRAVEAVSTAFSKKDHGDALKIVREVNPKFWPVPIEDGYDAKRGLRTMEPIGSGYLSETDYLPTWGRLSAWMHATNPFRPLPDLDQGAELGCWVIEKLIALLNQHWVDLAERDESIVCMMNEEVTGRVHVTGFGQVEGQGT